MKLSKRGEYALRSLIALGVAGALGRESVRFGELATAEAIPESFLKHTLAELREAGLVENGRDRAGDFRLGRSAGEIVVGDVVRLTDGPFAATGNPDDGLGLLIRHVRTAISGVLDRFTVGDLVAVTVYDLKSKGVSADRYLSGEIPEGRLRTSFFLREEFLDGAGI